MIEALIFITTGIGIGYSIFSLLHYYECFNSRKEPVHTHYPTPPPPPKKEPADREVCVKARYGTKDYSSRWLAVNEAQYSSAKRDIVSALIDQGSLFLVNDGVEYLFTNDMLKESFMSVHTRPLTLIPQ